MFDLGSGALALADSHAQASVVAVGGTVASYMPLTFLVITWGLLISIVGYLAFRFRSLGK